MIGVHAVILARDARPWLADYALELRADPQLLNLPFAEWQVAALHEGGVENITIAQLNEAPCPPPEGARLRTQALPLGTAGAIADLRDELDGRPVLVVYGSSFIDPRDVTALRAAARESAPGWGAIVGVIAPSARQDARETLAIDADGQLRHVYRGHESQERRRHRRLAGLMLLAPEALRCIPPDRYFDLKEQLFPELRAAGLRIDTLPTIGTLPVLGPEDYLRVQFDLLNNDLAPGMTPRTATSESATATALPGVQRTGRVELGAGCEIEHGARLIGPILMGARCRVEAGATLVGPTVLGDDCRIGRDAVVVCSALADGVVAEPGSTIRFSLLGPDHTVPLWDQRYYIDALCSRASGTLRGEVPPVGAGSGMQRAEDRGEPARRALGLAGKRTFDIVIALSVLLLTAPLWLCIALAVRLDSPGPVFFRQRRCGLDGHEFGMFKFRTMVVDADAIKYRLKSINEVDGPMFKLSDDPRITRVGRFLRKTSLDELPQVINVLRNEMSVVGPRPLPIGEMALDPRWRDARLSVKPGVTGPWQVYGRTSRGFHTWITLDLEYVRNRSFWFDLKIVAKTVMVVFRGL